MGLAILSRRMTAQERLPLVDICNDALVLRGGRLRQVLHCQPVQVALKEREEQAAVQETWTGGDSVRRRAAPGPDSHRIAWQLGAAGFDAGPSTHALELRDARRAASKAIALLGRCA